jgi:hypothetical protein
MQLNLKRGNAARSRQKMATATVSPAVDTGALSTEKVTYRAYVQLGTDKDGKTVIEKIKSQAEADKKDAKTGVSVNWQKLEEAKDKEGNPLWTLFNENEFVRYKLAEVSAFDALVPDKTQQLYIIQCGLNYLMNAKANGAMTALDEGKPEPTPLFNQNTIDLRTGVGDAGEYSINEAPSRKSLTDLDKLIKNLVAMGLTTPEQQEPILLALAAAKSLEAASGQEEAA